MLTLCSAYNEILSLQLTLVLWVTCSVAVLWPELWLQCQSHQYVWDYSGRHRRVNISQMKEFCMQSILTRWVEVDTLWILADTSRMIPLVWSRITYTTWVLSQRRYYCIATIFCCGTTYKHFAKKFSYSNNGKVLPIHEVYKGILLVGESSWMAWGNNLAYQLKLPALAHFNISWTMADTGQGARMIWMWLC